MEDIFGLDNQQQCRSSGILLFLCSKDSPPLSYRVHTSRFRESFQPQKIAKFQRIYLAAFLF